VLRAGVQRRHQRVNSAIEAKSTEWGSKIRVNRNCEEFKTTSLIRTSSICPSKKSAGPLNQPRSTLQGAELCTSAPPAMPVFGAD
jgi:hypothetical protein